MLYSELSDIWYFWNVEFYDCQGQRGGRDPKLSDIRAAAEQMPGLFPGKWVIYYPLISASKIGLKTALIEEAFFFV